MGQRAEPGSAASSPGACDEDIDPGVAAVPVCGCFCLFYAADRDQRNPKQWEETDAQIDKLSARLSSWISERVERRVKKAYPRVRKTEKKAAEKSDAFASGCGFYKIVLLFIIGAFLGDITETIFCRITMGVWMSRSSVVWGPFSYCMGTGNRIGDGIAL